MFKLKKSALIAAILAGVISMGSFGDVSAAPINSVTSTTMKNSSIKNLANDTRVFKVDKSIQVKFVTFRDCCKRCIRRSQGAAFGIVRAGVCKGGLRCCGV